MSGGYTVRHPGRPPVRVPPLAVGAPLEQARDYGTIMALDWRYEKLEREGASAVSIDGILDALYRLAVEYVGKYPASGSGA